MKYINRLLVISVTILSLQVNASDRLSQLVSSAANGVRSDVGTLVVAAGAAAGLAAGVSSLCVGASAHGRLNRRDQQIADLQSAIAQKQREVDAEIARQAELAAQKTALHDLAGDVGTNTNLVAALQKRQDAVDVILAEADGEGKHVVVFAVDEEGNLVGRDQQPESYQKGMIGALVGMKHAMIKATDPLNLRVKELEGERAAGVATLQRLDAYLDRKEGKGGLGKKKK